MRRRRIRQKAKVPKPISNWYICRKCMKPKLQHKFCANLRLCASRYVKPLGLPPGKEQEHREEFWKQQQQAQKEGK